jgi:hypothetical protein
MVGLRPPQLQHPCAWSTRCAVGADPAATSAAELSRDRASPACRHAVLVGGRGQGPAGAATQFELLLPSEASRVRRHWPSAARQALRLSPNTIVLLRAGLLFQEEALPGRHRELLGGIAADPNEPALQLLLGYVYDRIDLKALAAEAFERRGSSRPQTLILPLPLEEERVGRCQQVTSMTKATLNSYVLDVYGLQTARHLRS